MIIQTLVFIFAGILAISSIFAGFLWYNFKEDNFKSFLWFWFFAVICFILQGIYNQANIYGFLAFLTNIFCTYLLIKIYSRLLKINFSKKLFFTILIPGVFLSILLFCLNFSFEVSSFFAVLSIAIILIYAGIKGFKSSTIALDKGFGFLLIFNGFHFLDYPFLRPREHLATYGFAVAICLYFIYSIYFPLYIIKKIDIEKNIDLEFLINERNKDLILANQKLMETNSILEIKNAELNKMAKENLTLTTILVHDISNPIQIIFIFINQLKNQKSIEDFNLHLSNKYEKIVKAMSTIDEILCTVRNFHSAKLGKINEALVKVQLLDILNDSINMLEDKLQEKNIKISMILRQEMDYYVLGNESWIKTQIFTNLLTNAIKFSPTNGKIDIQIEKINGILQLKIRDYGIGIPEDLKHKLFNINESTTRLGTNGEKGTGLGLPIVKKYLEMMDANISLLNLEDNQLGTCFEIQFKEFNS